MIFILKLASAKNDNFFNFVSAPALNENQNHFYQVFLNEETTVEIQFFEFDFEKINSENFVLNLPNGFNYNVNRKYSKQYYGDINAYVGDIDSGAGTLFLAPNKRKKLLTGTIYLNEQSFSIRSLTGNLYMLITLNNENFQPCSLNENEVLNPSPPIPVKTSEPGDNDNYKDNPNKVLVDECYIRVLVGYTSTVATNEPDPYGLIVDAITQTNDAYLNSGIDQEIQLVRVYETSYDDTGQSQSLVRNRWRINGDGHMDEVHTERNLWDADMCALITNVGTGISYLNLTAEFGFNCTRRTYVSNKTFQHEFGHNHLCRHDPLNDPTASLYHGYGHPSGYFRTVMAYSSACGVGPCSRVNEFSGPNNFYFHAGTNTSYVTGDDVDQNNVAGHNDNDGTIVGYRTIDANPSYSNDYEFGNFEYVNLGGAISVTYTSTTNQMEFNPGSKGSFVASDEITLGEGFHAKSGSEFTAYLEPNCTAISLTGSPSSKISDNSTNGLEEKFKQPSNQGDLKKLFSKLFLFHF